MHSTCFHTPCPLLLTSVVLGFWSLTAATGAAGDAERNHREAVKLRPNVAINHGTLGDFLFAKEDWGGAELSFRKAIKLDPTDTFSHSGLGYALSKQNNVEDAIRSIQVSAALAPTNDVFRFNLGEWLSQIGDLDGAKESYGQAIKLKPGFVDAHHNLGNVLEMQEDLDGAKRSYQQAVKLDPEHIPALRNLARVLSQSGKTKAARDMSKKVMRLAEQEGVWPFSLAMTGMQSNEMVATLIAQEMDFVDTYVAALRKGLLTGADQQIQRLASTIAGNAPQGLEKLPPAVRKVRTLENTSQWVTRLWDDCLASGDRGMGCGYGATWFSGWATLMAHESLRDALPQYILSKWEFTVGGSALGEQCLFATLALGLPCVGYDLVCNLVTDANQLAHSLDVQDSVQFACDDAVQANLSQTGVLWLSDLLWPESVRKAMFTKAASTMPEGSTIISYQALPDGVSSPRLGHKRLVTAAVSWNSAGVFHLWTVRGAGRVKVGVTSAGEEL